MTMRAGLRAELLALVVVAGSIAAVLVWAGPQGTDLAAHAYQRALYVQHGFALWNNFWYAGRYSFVTYSVLYYPLAAVLGIKLLAVATVSTAALAFAVVLGRARPALGLGAAGSQTLALRAPGAPDPGREPAGVPAVDAAAGRLRDRALGRPSHARPARADDCRRRRPRGRALARVPGRRPLPVLLGGTAGGDHVLRARRRAHVAGRAGAVAALDVRRLPRRVPGRVPDPERGRRERAATALRRDPRGGAAALAAPLAAAAGRPRSLRAGCELERDAPRLQLREGPQRPGLRAVLLDAGDQVPARPPDSVVSRRGGGHDGALGPGVPGGSTPADRPRGLPPGRLPAEQAALRRVRREDLPRMAARPRRPLRRADDGALGLQREGGGGAATHGPLGVAPGLRDADAEDLPGAGRPADPHRSRRRARAVAERHPRRRRPAARRPLPAGDALFVVLEGRERLPVPARGRDDDHRHSARGTARARVPRQRRASARRRGRRRENASLRQRLAEEARRLELVAVAALRSLGAHRDAPLRAAGAKARCDHRHPDLAGEAVVNGRAEDDVGVVGGRPADNLGRLVDLEQRQVVAARDREQD